MRRAAVHLLAGITLALTATACGGEDDTGAPITKDDATPGAPEQCRDAFPQALGPADLDDLALLPDGFPGPPVEATLCLTAETVGGGQETASYATHATAEEVLAGYEAALVEYDAARDQDGIGRPIVTASDGGLVIQVTPQDGGFVLAFAR